MTNDGSNFTRLVLVRTSDGAGRAYQYAATRPNWAFRIALIIGLVVGLAFLTLVILPITIILIVVLFILSLIRRLIDAARQILENAGLVRSKEGRKNVRVIRR